MIQVFNHALGPPAANENQTSRVRAEEQICGSCMRAYTLRRALLTSAEIQVGTLRRDSCPKQILNGEFRESAADQDNRMRRENISCTSKKNKKARAAQHRHT